MRYTEFWDRMQVALGSGYARVWADMHVMGDLGERTVNQALSDGYTPKQVWAVVWRALELPDRDR